MAKPWTKADQLAVARVVAAAEAAGTFPDWECAGASVGRTRSAARVHWQQHLGPDARAALLAEAHADLQPDCGSASPAAADPELHRAADEMRVAALEAEVGDLRAATQPEARVAVRGHAEPRLSDDELWRLAEVDCARRVERARNQPFVDVMLDEPVVAIAFASDQHIAPGTPIDMARMREDAELIRRTPGLYAVLGGDGVDNHIKHRAAVLAARSQPGDQYRLFNHYLSILAPKAIAVLSGNHDAWSNQIAGIDMVEELCERQRLHYAPDEAYLLCRVGGVDYTIGVRHQYRYNSSLNLGHTVKRWYDMGQVRFDVGVICHHHEPHLESFIRHGVQCWAARPGSYQITSAHSRQYGFNPTWPTCPTFIFDGRERRISGFIDLREAVATLAARRAERGVA